MRAETLRKVQHGALITGLVATLGAAGAFTGYAVAQRDNNKVSASSDSWAEDPAYKVLAGQDAHPTKLPQDIHSHRDTIMGIDVENAAEDAFRFTIGIVAVGALVGAGARMLEQEREEDAGRQGPQVAPPLFR